MAAAALAVWALGGATVGPAVGAAAQLHPAQPDLARPGAPPRPVLHARLSIFERRHTRSTAMRTQ
eukprot:1550067-Pleurochrysis_carterae.AAC.1